MGATAAEEEEEEEEEEVVVVVLVRGLRRGFRLAVVVMMIAV